MEDQGIDFLLFAFASCWVIYYAYKIVTLGRISSFQKVPTHHYYMLIFGAIYCFIESIDLFHLSLHPYVLIMSFVILMAIGISALIKGIKVYQEKSSLAAVPVDFYVLSGVLFVILISFF